MKISISVSVGEAIDKLSILIIKEKFIQNKNQLKFIEDEIIELRKALSVISNYSEYLQELIDVNTILWHCNEERKELIQNKIFDAVYHSLTITESTVNDQRYIIKNNINKYFNSELQEQKSYVYLTLTSS